MSFVSGYDPQAGNKELMKNIGKLVTTTFEIGLAIPGAMYGGPIGGAIGSQLGRGIGGAVTGQPSAIGGDVSAALGWAMGEKFEGKGGPGEDEYGKIKGSIPRETHRTPRINQLGQQRPDYNALYGGILNRPPPER